MGNNPKMKICKNCNTPIYANFKICPNCHAKCKGSAGKVILTFVIILVIVIAILAIASKNNEKKEAIEKEENLSSELTEYTNEAEDVDSTQKDESTAPSQKENSNSVKGIRPEFKAAMDSYEAFYDDYCDFMKKYEKNPSDLTLLSEYSDMLLKSQEMNEKFEEWDDEDLSNEELKYYLDVQTRISKKLIEVAE